MKRKNSMSRRATTRQLLIEALIASPLVAAVAVVNVDWQADLNSMVAAVVSIVASALFWTAALRQKALAVGALYGGLALVLVALNASVAFGTLHRHTVDSRDNRGAIAGTVAERSEQRSRLSRARAEAVAIAGERPTQTLRAEIEKLAAENANRWRATKACATDRITLAASAAFCSQVASRKAVLAAAQRRDTIDAELAALNKDASAAPTVAEADPFGSGLAQLMAAVGWPLSPETQALLPTLRDALRALLLELTAAMGPAAALSLIARRAPMEHKGHAVGIAVRVRQFVRALLATRETDVAPPAPAPDASEPIARFLSERTEVAKGESVAAGELWTAWASWCHVKGIDTGTQKSFGLRLSMLYRREGTGRPRYIGLRLVPVASSVVALRQAAR